LLFDLILPKCRNLSKNELFLEKGNVFPLASALHSVIQEACSDDRVHGKSSATLSSDVNPKSWTQLLRLS
jgi:hypothetical protein